jgi:hypothetical protein
MAQPRPTQPRPVAPRPVAPRPVAPRPVAPRLVPLRAAQASAALWRLAPPLLWAALSACTAESTQLDPLPLAVDCPCAGGACPATSCGLRLEVEAASCLGEVEAVEVMVGATLEPVIWRPGDRLLTCAGIARGATQTLRARGDVGWSWTEPLSCPAPRAGETAGPIITRVLHCRRGAG